MDGKMRRLSFKSVGESHHSSRKLELVHSDVCGRSMDESIGGKRYFVSFIDDFSRCCAVYFLKNKYEVFKNFKEFEATVTNECGQTIGTLTVGSICPRRLGVTHQLTIAYTPQQNGTAESE